MAGEDVQNLLDAYTILHLQSNGSIGNQHQTFQHGRMVTRKACVVVTAVAVPTRRNSKDTNVGRCSMMDGFPTAIAVEPTRKGVVSLVRRVGGASTYSHVFDLCDIDGMKMCGRHLTLGNCARSSSTRPAISKARLALVVRLAILIPPKVRTV